MRIIANRRAEASKPEWAVGIFEFTMMRTRGDVDLAKMARLFHAYLDGGSQSDIACGAHLAYKPCWQKVKFAKLHEVAIVKDERTAAIARE
jgi:hypothetical protein